MLSHDPEPSSSREEHFPATFPPGSARRLAAANDPRHVHHLMGTYSEAGHPARSVERMVQAAFRRGMCHMQPVRIPSDPSRPDTSGQWSAELSRDEIAIVRQTTDGVIQQARGSGQYGQRLIGAAMGPPAPQQAMQPIVGSWRALRASGRQPSNLKCLAEAAVSRARHRAVSMASMESETQSREFTTGTGTSAGVAGIDAGAGAASLIVTTFSAAGRTSARLPIGRKRDRAEINLDQERAGGHSPACQPSFGAGESGDLLQPQPGEEHFGRSHRMAKRTRVE